MPPIRSARNRKPPPAGFDDLEDTLLEFSNKMKDAENDSGEGKKKYEALWPIFQITHQRKCWINITFVLCPAVPFPFSRGWGILILSETRKEKKNLHYML